MAAIALVLILITANLEVIGLDSDSNNSINNSINSINNSNNLLNNNEIGPLLNNNINMEIEDANNIALKQYIINSEPTNQEILNNQYNKYYWAN